MSTFIDPLEPESFEHNGQKPEVDESDVDESAVRADVDESDATDTPDARGEGEQDSFDEHLETEFKEFVGEATPADGPSPAG
ncbi:hypothetical protein ACEXQB_001175 [Herbiconiux sp. P18]|uniref:hypothetical protein n=1 Tax=Herbiconiux liangxiaofengii TaxID=3342795 RepID=UPI0035B87AB3